MIDGLAVELNLLVPSSPEVSQISMGSKPQPSNDMVGLSGVASPDPESPH